MMEWTDRHCRYFLRLVTRRTRLYTEMVTAAAILHGPRERLLAFDAAEHPVALQLGGSEPAELAAAARLGAEAGYDEINLNCGCPSDRVQRGRFGACLMKEPALVAECVAAMAEAVAVPVTVKCRIGVDDHEGYERLAGFVEGIAAAGCSCVVVHARKAWLKGLSPKENREVPPLRYEQVYRLKRDFPDLAIVLNGGLASLEAVEARLDRVDGAMIGRAAYQDPWTLAEADRRIFGAEWPAPDRFEVARSFADYAEGERAAGTPLKAMTRHILGLFNGMPGARAWRRTLSQDTLAPEAGPEVILRALAPLEAKLERKLAA